MARIVVADDCGNAPKKKYVRDFLAHCAKAEIDDAIEMLAEDAVLDRPGSDSVHGLDEIRGSMEAEADRDQVTVLKVDNLISHGDRCAANGVIEFKAGRSVAFCGMYTFNGHGKKAKLKTVETYLIELR